MRTGKTFEAITQDSELRDALDSAFDFRVGSRQAPLWFRTKAEEEFDLVAEDASQGVFLVGRSSGRVLFVSSEGQAGVIARSIDELLELMVSHPGWRGLLKFSGGGQLLEMKRAAPYLQPEFDEQFPEMAEHRLLVMRKLRISSNPVAIDRLHTAVTTGLQEVTVEAEDGRSLDGLFNRFTVDGNP